LFPATHPQQHHDCCDPAARADDIRADVRVGISQRTVASYGGHSEAVQAINRLTGQGFPADRAAIVGRGLQPLEKATGRLSPKSVAARAATSGAIIGITVSWLLVVFDATSPMIATVWVAINGAILGGVIGAVVGLIGHVATRGRRHVTAISAVRAERYDVLVDADLAVRAAGFLGPTPPDPRAAQRAAPDRELDQAYMNMTASLTSAGPGTPPTRRRAPGPTPGGRLVPPTRRHARA
jgi:hypothetical protein